MTVTRDAEVGEVSHPAQRHPARRVFVTGGRITRALADYFATQLRVMRPDVTLIPSQSGDWPATLIDLAGDDLLLVFDIRRYEANMLRLVETAAAQGAVVALLTDPWVSPVAAHANPRFVRTRRDSGASRAADS